MKFETVEVEEVKTKKLPTSARLSRTPQTIVAEVIKHFRNDLETSLLSELYPDAIERAKINRILNPTDKNYRYWNALLKYWLDYAIRKGVIK